MTLKQFGQLAGGVIMALVFYALPVHPVIKWPLILISALSGILLAFVPFQERPLSLWVVAFFKAVYSPTQFLWQRQAMVPDYFIVKTKPLPKEEVAVSKEQAVAEKERVQAYLSSLPQQKQLSALEKAEREMLAQFNSLLAEPMLRGENMGKETVEEEEEGQRGVKPTPPPVVAKAAQSVKPKVQLPQPVKVTPTGRRPEKVFVGEGQGVTRAASFSRQAPIPNPPTEPNLVVGQVIDKYGRIIENAIIEIKDENGVPARALRTNKLGHFRIVTPLKQGKYAIETEKEGYEFDTISLEVKGEVIDPVSIIGQAVNEEAIRAPEKPHMIYQINS